MSTSQPQVAPPATGAPTPSSSTQDSTPQPPAIPSESVTRPSANTNANVNQDAPIAAAGTPSPGPNTTTAAAPQATTADEPLSLNDKLNAGDRYWKFKFAIMAVIIITGLVGIGCFAWLMTTRTGASDYYILDSYWGLWPSLISWSISIAWCLICIIVFVVRKRTVHPGVRVSMELLLWLAFIVTALFALFSLQNIMDYGMYGGPDQWGYDYSSSSSHGDYVLAANNTWVWQEDTSYITSPRDCTSRYSVFSEMNFKDCAEQDAFVNKLWAEKPQRARVNLTGVVCQFFGLVLHFVLFVWACVDTHRRNRTKVSKDAEKLAAGIVQTMINNGAIIPPPGQAHMQPGMGQRMYYQVPPQGYPVQHMYMQQVPGQQQQQQPQFAMPQQMGQQGYMVPMQYHPAQQGAGAPGVGVAGPSNEKGAGPRYA